MTKHFKFLPIWTPTARGFGWGTRRSYAAPWRTRYIIWTKLHKSHSWRKTLIGFKGGVR